VVGVCGGVFVEVGGSRAGVFLVQVPDALEVGIPHPGRVFGGDGHVGVAVMQVDDRVVVPVQRRDAHPGHQLVVVRIIQLDLVVQHAGRRAGAAADGVVLGLEIQAVAVGVDLVFCPSGSPAGEN